MAERRHAFWGVWQYIKPLRRWIKEQRRRGQGKCALSQSSLSLSTAAWKHLTVC